MFPAELGADVLPAMPVHALSPMNSTTSVPYFDAENTDEKHELSHSASYTHLPGISKDAPPLGIKRNFSENILTSQLRNTSRLSDTMQSVDKELFRRTSKKAKKRLSGQIFSLSTDEEDAVEIEERKVNGDNDEPPKSLGRSVTGTIRSFARKSWMPSSRSVSPALRDGPHLAKGGGSPERAAASMTTTASTASESLTSRSSSRSSNQDDQAAKVKPQQHASQGMRSLTVLGSRTKSETNLRRLSRVSSAASLKSHFSSDKSLSKPPSTKIPPLPVSISSDRLSNFSLDTNKRKDPLWNVFRGIESECSTFQSKSCLHKAKVLRTSLLPFLSKYAQHPSNRLLRAEDLDRRAVILNKWWTSLLQMLCGNQNQSISGTDRPAFLEATIGIMMRPEWRVPGFSSISSLDTPRRPSISKSKSSNSIESDEADFLIESVHQNVRNIFVQNLLSQMEFVIDKLSMRSAPASFVAFSGKTCAYAFFYCPGIADMLVRLWRIAPGTLRRIFSESGVDRGDKLDIISQALISRFPPPVRSLSVTSQASLSRHLQPKTCIPPGTEQFNWHGPWIWRWSGRDSDLFFVFTKYFHILASEFLQESMSIKNRTCIPGLVPVHAQILTVLEKTIYRQAGQHNFDNHSSIGDLEGPDASAALPMTIANASRSIAENRLIMLLRDILATADPELASLRVLFVSSFDNIIKAATRKIPLYNNDACFVLCDLMEVVLPIMLRYHQNHVDTQVLDWPFWLRVFRQMMQSQSTLTQIRLIAFIYSTWSILVSNEERKKELVLDWLLDSSFFHRNFCHWSPMVRHYFYRLLCWRVARHDGDPSDLDIEIIETLALRLNHAWAHYQYLTAEAEMRGMVPLSSAPCSPAPSRCLIIIRTDGQPLPPASFTSFDKIFPPGWINSNTPYHSHSSVLNSIPVADSPSQNGNNSKKRWSLFRSINPFGSSTLNTRPGEVTPPTSREGAGYFNSQESTPGSGGVSPVVKPISRPVTPPHQAYSFKFSLEWVEARSAMASKNRRLVAPLLPTNAQRIIEQRRYDQEVEISADLVPKPAPATKPTKPKPEEMANARYSGRALAEWSQVLMEYQNFYLRRKQEGVPRDDLVEIPIISVETFRMVGG